MKSRCGGMLAEVISACFIAAIIIPTVVSMILCSTALIQTSRDSLMLERAREEVLSELAAGCLSFENTLYKGGCKITDMSSSDDFIRLHISRDGFKERRESFVLWHKGEEKE
jgi:hypothetical protein